METLEEIISNLAPILQDNNSALVYSDMCLSCKRMEPIRNRFLLLNIPWVVEGKDYDTVGVLLCKYCDGEIDQRQVIKNLIYAFEEFNREVL